MTKIKSICQIGFENSLNVSSSDKVLTEEEKLSRLGFNVNFFVLGSFGHKFLVNMFSFILKNLANPVEDFKESRTRPLAIDFMDYFATQASFRTLFQNILTNKLSKNADYAFPFAKACIHMVEFVCNFLSIGHKTHQIDKQHELMFVMFTMNNDGFHEFLAKSLWLFHRLWIEMKAQQLDFDRVCLTFLQNKFYAWQVL